MLVTKYENRKILKHRVWSPGESLVILKLIVYYDMFLQDDPSAQSSHPLAHGRDKKSRITSFLFH